MRGVYLLHFSEPYKHAQHYLGYSSDVDARLRDHRSGHGARLIQVITEAGITFEVVRVWKGQTRTFERKLKGSHSSLLCPTCNPKSAKFRGQATEKPFRHRSKRRVTFTKRELASIRRGYKHARAGKPCPLDASSAFKRGYRKAIYKRKPHESPTPL